MSDKIINPPIDLKAFTVFESSITYDNTEYFRGQLILIKETDQALIDHLVKNGSIVESGTEK